MDGPGCVVRLWSPKPQDAGNIRIYLDGADEPVIEAPMEALLAGKWQTTKPGEPGEKGERGVSTPRWTPFPDPIACERSRGWNLYFPISYAKHCKICTDKQDIYYHVDYRVYPKGTEMETFELSMLPKMPKQLRDLRAGVETPARKAEENLFFLKNLITSENEATLKPG